MDFITWWFGVHYIISTILTPSMTFAWCIFAKASVLRALIALIWMFITWFFVS